jgi:purine-nucleoside phosphorylase
LVDLGCAFSVGTAWTTDAPYRETIAELRAYSAEGVAVVEMEAATVFAVASYRGVDAAAMFAVSDCLAEHEWRPDFGSRDLSDSLAAMVEAAVNALT